MWCQLGSSGVLGPLHTVLQEPIMCTPSQLPWWLSGKEMQEICIWSLDWKILWRREWLPILACSIFAWRIPWTEEPSRLYSMGSQRVGHDWTTFTSLLNSDLILYIGCLNLATVGVSTPSKVANATNQCFSLREILKYLPVGHWLWA